MRSRKIREKLGQIFKVLLDNNYMTFGQVTGQQLYTFFDIKIPINFEKVSFSQIVSQSIIFRLCVGSYAINYGRWEVLSTLRPKDDLLKGVVQYSYDDLRDVFTVWDDNGKRESCWQECKNLEPFAVWQAEHVEERLKNHFNGVPCIIYERLKPKFAQCPKIINYKD